MICFFSAMPQTPQQSTERFLPRIYRREYSRRSAARRAGVNNALTHPPLEWRRNFVGDPPLPSATALARSQPAPRATPKRRAAPSSQRFAFVEVFDAIEAVRAPWAEIAAAAPASPYQSFDFARLWLETIGAARGVAPMIVVARDEAGDVVALLPLGAVRKGPLRLAAFLGGKDANLNLGLFRPGLAWSREEIAALFREAARLARPRVDAFLLVNQPRAWRGVANPIAVAASQPSPSFAYKSALPADFSAWRDAHASKDAQKKLRKKAKRLEAMGALIHRRAVDGNEAERVLAAFDAQRGARMRALGIPDAYASAPARAFLDGLALCGLAAGAPRLELHALFLGDRIVATFGALCAGDRMSGLFISYDADPEIAKSSPGELMVQAMVREAIERGLSTFDLGVGEARYKDEACESVEELFDSAIAATPLGRLAALAFALKQRAKRRVKHAPRLRALAARLRAALRRRGQAR
jgi:CelD/BcsL family acetyltransferase involved in cellulose biosynthesis